MTHLLPRIQKLFAAALLIFLVSTPALYAQVCRNKSNGAGAYRGSYQRFGSGHGSLSTFEIRNGTLWASGYNVFGQLGDGSTTNRTTPVQIGTDNNWVSIYSDYHTVGLKSDGTLWAWGRNSSGELGDGNTVDKLVPTQVGTDNDWVSAASADYHTVALKTNGTLWAWGSNVLNQLGDGGTTNRSTPGQVGSDAKWAGISCGLGRTMATKSDGTLWAWGHNSSGEIGNGSLNNESLPVQIGTDNKWVTVRCGTSHSVGIKTDGTIWAWGYNGQGQLGDGTTTDRTSPIQIGTNNTWTEIAGGNYHTAAIRCDGTIWAWGLNVNGQLGDGTTVSHNVPTQTGTDNKWVSITCGASHNIALKSDGSLWDWGRNLSGELGDGTTTDKPSPIKLAGSYREWLQVENGGGSTVALKSDGTLWGWGYNADGEVGDNSTNDKKIPVQIGFDNKWSVIASSTFHYIALKSDGTLWAWGYNGNGELGIGVYGGKTAPVQVGTDNKWVSIACGGRHNLAIKSDGTLWAWGWNVFGQIGDGTTANALIPVQIGTDNNWVNIAAGVYHSLATKSDGSLWTWGYNVNGQLGDGTNADKSIPTQIGTGSIWTRPSGGDNHSAAMRANGSIWTWGLNNSGQLGDGSGTSHNLPAPLITSAAWMAVYCGQTFSKALKSDGTIAAWGRNDFGSIGDGTTTAKSSPTAVAGQGGIVSLSRGCNTRSAGIIKANRNSICFTGLNSNGQLGDNTSNNALTYNCTNSICRSYSLATAGATSYTQPLCGTGNRTDYQSNCTLAASVTPSTVSTAVTGTATVQAFLDASVQAINGQYYVQRHYDILPVTNPNAATATITLYFTQAEFTAYNNAVATGAPKLPTTSTDATGIAALRVTQYHGSPTGGYAPANYPATWGGTGPAHVLINPADANITWNADDARWEVTFDVTGFSGFFVSAGNNNPLPLKLLSFTAQKGLGQANRLDWATATEDAGTTFHITRSEAGTAFQPIGAIAGKGSNAAYTFYDEQPLPGINYYRLKMEGRGGEFSYSNVAIVKNSSGGNVTITPIPAGNTITITNTDASLNGSPVAIHSMDGRLMYHAIITPQSTITVADWPAGIYTLRLPGGESVRIVVAH